MYKVGYISPVVGIKNNLQLPLCYKCFGNPYSMCANKNFSMCRYPTGKYNARLYLDYKPPCNCDKYLYRV